MRGLTLIASMAVYLAATALPAHAINDPWYFGASAGLSDPSQGRLDSDMGVKLYGGYHFNPGISAQIGYVNLGDFDRRGGGSVEIRGFDTALLGRIAVSEKLAIVGKAGLFSWDSSASGAAGSDDNGVDATFGIGAQYFLPKDMGLMILWDRFHDTGDTNVDYLSVGISFGY